MSASSASPAQGHVGKVCRAGCMPSRGSRTCRAARRARFAAHRCGRSSRPARTCPSPSRRQCNRRIATIACDDLEARGEERAHLVADGIEIEVDDVAIVAQGNVDELGERHVETGKQDVDDANRRTTQGEGIGRPGGSRPDGEDAANGVELVGERRDGAREVTRQVVVGETRTIVIGDSERNLGVSPEKRA